LLCDTLDELHGAELDRFRASVADLVPFLGDRVDALRTWDDVRMLRVQVDRLRRWFRPGLLCIGDATHAMSPIDGVGINLAVHDAIAATNLLVRPSGTGPCLPGTSSGSSSAAFADAGRPVGAARAAQDCFLSPLRFGRRGAAHRSSSGCFAATRSCRPSRPA
jgi:hypothetical protein